MQRKPVVEVYDTTLRDGTQRYELSISCADKVRIARRLDALGVAVIEGGWPGSNPKDAEFFARARDIAWRTAKIAAFGSTRRVGVPVDEDANLKALLEARTPVCTLVGKSWMLHVRDVLRTTPDENLRLIEESIAYLRAHGRTVIFDAEHFFDGYAEDSAYALEVLCAAIRGGAQTLVLCETNGGRLPGEVQTTVAGVRTALADQGMAPLLGIHAHNDSGCGVANTLQAVEAGAVHVQGTVNGYGERCGNADLCAVIPTLELKMGQQCLPTGHLEQLAEVSRFVAEVANQALDDYAPYVGRNAFAHKGGIHVSGMRRSERAYQHVTPHLVGNEQRVVLSELSGQSNLLHKLEETGLEVDRKELAAALDELKRNEARGFAYEAAEASVALMLLRRTGTYQPPYRLVDYMVNVEHRDGRGTFAEATVKIEIKGHTVHTAAEGDGPVNALDCALRKALLPLHPEVTRIRLCDYKVRILDGEQATSAVTRVLVDTTNGREKWSTVGASANIVEASWLALTDALEYGLFLASKGQQPCPDVWEPVCEAVA